MIRAVSLLPLLSLAWPAAAQEVEGCGPLADGTAEAITCRAVAEEELLASRLATERASNLEARANEGWTLVAFAAASIATGAAVLGAGVDANDDRTLWGGIGTLSWGAINALFSLFLFDVSGSVARDIEADRAARGADLVRAREDAARDQYSTATLIAVNAGLDVFYVAAGLLLFALGSEADPGDSVFDVRDGLVGYGAAMAAQGSFLLVYDVVTWLLAQDRGDRMLHMDRDAEAP